MTEEVQLYWARKAWPLVCGHAARFSRPDHLRRGVLHVAVEDSVWVQEMSMRRAGLLAALKREMPVELHPVDLKFFVGPFGDGRKQKRGGRATRRGRPKEKV